MSVEHVVVLCLENRSFDHMLGFLPHPDPTFEGLRDGGPYTNPTADGTPVAASPDARPVIPFGPDHSHDGVLQQLARGGPAGRGEPTNQGFIASYALKAAGRSPTTKGGLVAWLLGFVSRPKSPSSPPPGTTAWGPLIMRCQPPEQVPVLARLATDFAVCDHWFCSVPGETWPNRNFLHAATSDGETNIEIRPYYNRTIFELLEENGSDWRIYHDDTPQAWAFPNLWDTADRHAKWFPMTAFAGHVEAGDLPPYTFIEPNHRPPLHTLDRIAALGGQPGQSDSQHPENNLVSPPAYESYAGGVETDFERGERLIATIYEALRKNSDLFATTVFVITYDEHGGFYDHVPPTEQVPAPGQAGPNLLTRLFRLLWRTNATAFDFTSVGIRVPAVVVSPLVAAGVVDHTFYEHASVPATLRKLFAPAAAPLTARDEAAATFDQLWTLPQPRADLPDLSAYTKPAQLAPEAPSAVDRAVAPPPALVPGEAEPQVPDYYREFVQQAELVRRHLDAVGEPETQPLAPATSPQDGHDVTVAFSKAAARHRG